jgi:imidazole glycerol-phosphate synthase subunit HisH
MIAVLDYGSGNVKAFLNAYERMKVPALAARCVEDLDGAERVVLPGVGAFDTALRQFNECGMKQRVEEMVLVRGVPLLGVCVGMQMLANGSDEGDSHGLGWISGRVRRLAAERNGCDLRLPHMGWNRIDTGEGESLLRDLPNGGRFYFLHSYYFDCEDSAMSVATATYGRSFTCAVRRQNIFAVQFHPEKSHEDGMKLLKNFAEA